MHDDSTLPGIGPINNGDDEPGVRALCQRQLLRRLPLVGKSKVGTTSSSMTAMLYVWCAFRFRCLNSEESSGYDSSNVSMLPASPGFGYYESSYAMIHAKAPSATVKVGDEAAFSATVTGAYAGASGSKSAENITLFVSDPVGDGNAVAADAQDNGDNGCQRQAGIHFQRTRLLHHCHVQCDAGRSDVSVSMYRRGHRLASTTRCMRVITPSSMSPKQQTSTRCLPNTAAKNLADGQSVL